MVEKGSKGSTHGVEVDLARPLIGGGIVMFGTFVGVWAIGRLSDWEARLLVETSLSGLRSFCNTSILAAGTILALMLTAIGMSREASSVMKVQHYERIRQIALIDTVLFVGATAIVLLFNVPIAESKSVPSDWYPILYYVIVGCTSLIGGTLVAVVLMLYDAIGDIIDVMGLGQTDKEMVASETSGEASPQEGASSDERSSGGE